VTDVETIYCPECGAENLPWADFCRLCGKEFSRFPGVNDDTRQLERNGDGNEDESRGGYDTRDLVLIILLSFFALAVILMGFISGVI